ncbi:MAG: Xaa-Pro dipeptidase [Gammaproteobacteria bacterium]|nr:Xaa-Pro dipeptidase [Gammaproteobacteria bacterium]
MNMAALYSEHLENLLANHRGLMQKNGYDTLLIPSGEPVGIYLDDMDYPFKSSFFFRTYVPLTGLPFSYLIIGLSGKPKLVYYQPADYWHTPPSDPAGYWVEHFDLVVVSEQAQIAEHLPKDDGKLAILGGQNSVTTRFSKSSHNPEKLINEIYWQRAYKSDYEIACIQQANLLAAKAHKAAENAFREKKSEQQIHLAYLESLGVLEHELPYGNIVCLNEHASILHYMDSSSHMPEKHLSFLIDAGATVNGYHADITRTYSHSDGEFADLIQAMDKAQLACIDSIEVGKSYVDLHIETHLRIAQILKDFDLLDMSADSIVEAGLSNVFFPHGLGHFIGLQVHDVGGHFTDQTGVIKSPPDAHPFLRLTRIIEAGMAFTIEPGLYFIEMLLRPHKSGSYCNAFNWEKIDRLKPYGGIRIEDNVVVKGNKVVNLTREAFKMND